MSDGALIKRQSDCFTWAKECLSGRRIVVTKSMGVGQFRPVCLAMAGRHDRMGAGIYGIEAPAPLRTTGNGPSGPIAGTQWAQAQMDHVRCGTRPA
jgi:hypothetical protein